MFHKAKEVKFKDGTNLEVTFCNGRVFSYDIAALFDKYPQLRSLENRTLFEKGQLIGCYGISWNDELDLETETIYQEGELVSEEYIEYAIIIGENIANAREEAGYSQKQLAQLTNIDQADISKIESGKANPTLSTLLKIANPLNIAPTKLFAN